MQKTPQKPQGRPGFLTNLATLDLRSLAILRISLAYILLIDLLRRLPSFVTFYTDEGLLPRSLLFSQSAVPWRISIYFINGTLEVTALLFLAAGLCAFLLLIGWRTRLMAVLSWFFLMSLHARNPLVTNSADHTLRYILFWAMFLPIGARYSLDARVDRSTAKSDTVVSPACLAYLGQTCFIYWFAVLIKSQDAQWRSGEAVLCAVKVGEFATSFGAWMARFPGLLKLLTHYTLIFETLGPVLLILSLGFGRFRIPILLAFISLQLGFGMFLDVGIFPLVSSVAMIAFVGSSFYDGAWKRIQSAKALADGLKSLSDRIRRIAEKLAAHLPAAKPDRPKKRAGFWEWTSVALIVYVFFWNVGSVYPRYWMPAPLAPIGYMTQLDQRWGMFTPAGAFTGWFVFQGELRNGKLVDVFQKKPVNFERPTNFRKYYQGKFWKEYLAHLWEPYYKAHNPYLAWNKCQEWNRSHTGDEQVKRIDIYGLFEVFYPTPKPRQSSLIYSHICSEN